MQRFKRTGFTLIELLIVVAIIAILALIAVPNFLEAQTRAKTARAKADMRSLATAQEAYMVDWNSYTWTDAGDYQAQPTYVEGLRVLTSPVAFITQIPHDSFGGYRDSAGRMQPLFEFGSGSSGDYKSSGRLSEPPGQYNPANHTGMPADTFLIRSTGPDAFDDTSIGGFPWPLNGSPNWRYSSLRGAAAVLAMLYDPTNGTVSVGDIFRVGGQKPVGPAYDVLYAAASK